MTLFAVWAGGPEVDLCPISLLENETGKLETGQAFSRSRADDGVTVAQGGGFCPDPGNQLPDYRVDDPDE